MHDDLHHGMMKAYSVCTWNSNAHTEYITQQPCSKDLSVHDWTRPGQHTMSVGDQVHEHVQGQLSVVCMMNSHQAKLVDACLSHLTSLHAHSPSCLYDFGHRTSCGIRRLVSFKEGLGVIFVFLAVAS